MMAPEQQSMAIDGGPLRGPQIVPPGFKRASCKRCGDTLVMWVVLVDGLGRVRVNPETGRKRMVLVNLGTIATGDLAIAAPGQMRRKGVTEWVEPDQLYESHWTTCPHAKGPRP